MILPVIRRNLFVPLFMSKSRSPRLQYWRYLEETQYYPREKLEEIQWARLKKLWNFLWKNNGYYRKKFLDAGLNENSLRYPTDISKLPILTKEEVRENTDALISNGFDKKKLLHFKTGGSTGKALDIFITEECSELRNACACRHDHWSGWELGEPVGAVWGNPPSLDSWKKKVRWWLLEPVIYLDTMNVNEEAVLRFAKEWKRAKPTLLFGHSHSIYLLSQYVQELGITEIRPKGIIGTSMMLLENERETIESVFGVKVFNRYGCEEVSLIASECEKHEGMHLNIEHLFIEFINDDGSPAGPGEQSKIVVTDLMNKAMPFVRYQVEDYGIPTDRICSCGRGLPLMDEVVGRTADFLVRHDGTKIAGVSLIENTLTKIEGIKQMQIIQDNINDIHLNIVAGPDFCEDTKKSLISYFKALFGAGVSIEVELTRKIEQDPSGKYRFSICKVKT